MFLNRNNPSFVSNYCVSLPELIYFYDTTNEHFNSLNNFDNISTHLQNLHNTTSFYHRSQHNETVWIYKRSLIEIFIVFSKLIYKTEKCVLRYFHPRNRFIVSIKSMQPIRRMVIYTIYCKTNLTIVNITRMLLSIEGVIKHEFHSVCFRLLFVLPLQLSKPEN